MTGPTLQEVLGIQIDIGVEAQKFLDSELGLSLLSRQRTEIADFQTQIENTKLTFEEFKVIQLEIIARRRALAWFVESVNEAKVAYQQLEQSEAED